MSGLRIARFIGVVALMVVAVFVLGRPASADFSIVIPAGVACDFALGVDSVGEQPVYREFEDKDGNLRVLNAGKGVELTFTNTDTGATLALKPDGSVSQITFNPDGSVTLVATGHNVIILYPTDVPAGPSTIQYVGRVVISIDPDEVWTVQSVSGTSTDICATLS